VVVIPKPGKDDYANVSSYQPIGLLSVFGKVLEKLFINRDSRKLQTKHLLSEYQYGFTSQKSTEDALHAAINRLRAANRDGHLIVAVSLT
jgi:hypothetical protein